MCHTIMLDCVLVIDVHVLYCSSCLSAFHILPFLIIIVFTTLVLSDPDTGSTVKTEGKERLEEGGIRLQKRSVVSLSLLVEMWIIC